MDEYLLNTVSRSMGFIKLKSYLFHLGLNSQLVTKAIRKKIDW